MCVCVCDNACASFKKLVELPFSQSQLSLLGFYVPSELNSYYIHIAYIGDILGTVASRVPSPLFGAERPAGFG